MKRWLKILVGRLTGYWFCQKNHLPVGADLFIDLERKLGKDQFRTVFDIGGNVGQTVEKYAPFFNRAIIYSLEPVTDSFIQLSEKAKSYNNVRCFNIGLSGEKRQADIYLSALNSSMNSLKKVQSIVPETTETVFLETMDEFAANQKIESIDFVKIDVEGDELNVLHGARKLIEHGKIGMILCEVKLSVEGYERHTNLYDCLTFMNKHDFVLLGIYDLWLKGLKTASHYGDALFIHKSRLGQINI